MFSGMREMTKTRLFTWTALTVALSVPFTARASAAETQSVIVEAESAVSFEAATEKALRDAVRQVAGVVLASETKVADFQLVCDAIYSRAAGYVRSHRVLDERRTLDGAYAVKIHAEVARGSIRDDFLAIQGLIERMGRPRFVVAVEERSGSEHGVEVWVEGAINEFLEETGFSVLHTRTRDESVERQFMRAVAAGDKDKAAQLKLQMGAPYGVDVIAFGRKRSQRVHGIAANFSTVELQVTVAHRDSAEVLASKSVTGRGGSTDTSGMQRAARQAVAEIFPEVLKRILYHWTKDLDVGAAIAVQVHDDDFTLLSALKSEIERFEGVRNVEIVEAPSGGIAVLRVLGRVRAADIAARIPKWTGRRLKANVEGPRLVTAERPEVAEARPVDGAPEEGRSGSADTSRYVLPAVIVGAAALLGIIAAALILKRR